MPFEIKLSEAAQLDLKEARRYYALVSKPLLTRFDAEKVTNLERLISISHIFNSAIVG